MYEFLPTDSSSGTDWPNLPDGHFPSAFAQQWPLLISPGPHAVHSSDGRGSDVTLACAQRAEITEKITVEDSHSSSFVHAYY